MQVNSERLVSSMKQMSEIGFVSKEEGINRLALNESDKKARDLFVQWLKDERLHAVSYTHLTLPTNREV